MKKIVTALLVACLLAISDAPAQTHKEEPQPQFFIQCVMVILVIGIGVVVVYGLVKMCKSIPPVDPPPPPPPPPVPPWTNYGTNMPPWTNPPLASYPMYMVTTNQTVSVQQSYGLSDWLDCVTVTLTNLGDRVALTGAGLCLTSSIVNGVAVFYLPGVPDQQPLDKHFFRMLSLPK